jgi:hypothetical protein
MDRARIYIKNGTTTGISNLTRGKRVHGKKRNMRNIKNIKDKK